MKRSLTKRFGALAAAGVIILSTTSFAQEIPATPDDSAQKPAAVRSNSFQIAMGIVASSAYKDALSQSRPDYDIKGGGTWIDLEAALAFRTTSKLYLIPKFELMAMRIKTESYYGMPGSEQATIIFLPGIRGQYSVGAPGSKFFVGGELSLVAPQSDLSSPSLESGGISYGLNAGYTFSSSYELMVSYKYVPIKANSGSDWEDYYYYGYTSSDETSNFGGLGITFRRLFRI